MINMHLSISDFKDFATSYSCFESFKTAWSERRKELELNTIEQYPTSQAIDSPPRLSSMFSMFRYPICISNLVSECLRHGLEWLRGLASTMYTGTFRRRLFFAFFASLLSSFSTADFFCSCVFSGPQFKLQFS